MPHHRPLALVIAAAATLALCVAVAVQPARAKPRKHAAARAAAVPDTVPYGEREDVMRFADEVADRHGLDPAWARAALADSRFVPSITRYIMPPPAGTAKNWFAYRDRFVEARRIAAGVAFW